MFAESAFNQDIGSWNTATVDTMGHVVRYYSSGRAALWPQESERITTKADCYGFAVLMWELATRLYPWLGLGLLHVRLTRQ